MYIIKKFLIISQFFVFDCIFLQTTRESASGYIWELRCWDNYSTWALESPKMLETRKVIEPPKVRYLKSK